MQSSTQSIDDIIRTRKTVKVLAEQPFPTDADPTLVDDLVASASWAPFHKPADRVHQTGGPLSAIMPWRFHVLDASGCRTLREVLIQRGDTSKMPSMLAAADTLILATWLPNPAKAACESLFEPTLDNMEHIAAASAAIQNLLLAATAREIPNYWSSGGALRQPEFFDLLGIPQREILLGAVFLFPADIRDATVATSSLRDKRGESSGWVRRITLD